MPSVPHTSENAPVGPTPGDAPTARMERKGWLAGLPAIPEPVQVEVPGLTPRTALLAWLAVAVGILALGIGLNWALTDGGWVPPTDRVVDSDAALGDTPVQFITTHPFDLFTASLFIVSVLVLAVSLVTRREDGGPGLYPKLALGALGAALLYGIAFSVLRHFAPPGDVATRSAMWILVLLAAVGLGFALLARYRNPLAARRHEIRAIGWVLFAFHWAASGMYYFVIENGDWVNMLFSYASVFLLTYFAYQEFVSRALGEDNKSLRFLAGAIVIAATVWFAFLRIEFLAKWIIETVAGHTVLMLQALGHDVRLGIDGRTGFLSAISYAETLYPRTVIIILACTAIQSIMIFVAAALAVDSAPWRRRFAAILITAPIVYFLNLLRNTGIIIMWADRWLERNFAFVNSSDFAFSIAHNWIGKGGSLIALVLIALIVFRILPETLRALIGVLDLPRRRGPLEQQYRAIRGLKDDKPAPAAEASS
jgi:archaeosortase A